MAISSAGRRCLAFDSLVLLELALPSPKPFRPEVASCAAFGLA